MNDTLQASIIVCTYNRADMLRRCIASIANQRYARDAFELLVVDNNSSDGTKTVVAEAIAQFPGLAIRYIFEPEQGLSNARNRGYREAAFPILVFIDDDATAEPDWLERLIAPLRDPSVHAVGGSVRLEFPWEPPDWLREGYRTWLGEYIPIMDSQYQYKTGMQLPIGCNMAIRRDSLAAVGPFEPDYGRCGTYLNAGEETRVLERVLAAGHAVIIQPAAVVHHWMAAERLTKSYFYRLDYAEVRQKFLTEPPRGIGARILRLLVRLLRRCFHLLLRSYRFITDPYQFFRQQHRIHSILVELCCCIAPPRINTAPLEEK